MNGGQVEVHDGKSCDCIHSGRHMLVTDKSRKWRTKVIAIHLSPRPNESRLGMTSLGVLRDEYSATVEGHPPRFVMTLFGYAANPEYFAWASRADTWAEALK